MKGLAEASASRRFAHRRTARELPPPLAFAARASLEYRIFSLTVNQQLKIESDCIIWTYDHILRSAYLNNQLADTFFSEEETQFLAGLTKTPNIIEIDIAYDV